MSDDVSTHVRVKRLTLTWVNVKPSYPGKVRLCCGEEEEGPVMESMHAADDTRHPHCVPDYPATYHPATRATRWSGGNELQLIYGFSVVEELEGWEELALSRPCIFNITYRLQTPPLGACPCPSYADPHVINSPSTYTRNRTHCALSMTYSQAKPSDRRERQVQRGR